MNDMGKNYSPGTDDDFNEYLYLLDHTIAGVYVIAKDTYEMLYGNTPAVEKFSGGDYHGRACYEYICGRTTPCPWCILPETRANEDTEKEVYMEPLDIWLRVKSRGVRWQGREAAALFAVDITDMKRRQLNLAFDKQSLEEIINNLPVGVGVCAFTNNKLNTVTINPYLKELLGMGQESFVSPDPETIHMIHPDDREATLAEMRRCAEPNTRVKWAYRFRKSADDDYRWFQFEAKSVGEPGNVTVFIRASDITAEKLEEDRFERAYRELSDARPDALGSFHLNLTKNWCGEGKSSLDFVLRQQESGTVDGYFTEFAKLIADETIRQRFFEIFNRESLLEAWSRGETKASIEYPVLYPDGLIYWREGLLIMIQNPRTGDVEAFTYAIDINDRKKNEELADRVMNEKIDFIALLNPTTGEFEFRNLRDRKLEGLLRKRFAYDTGLNMTVERFAAEEERALFQARANLGNVLSELAKGNEYSFTYTRAADDGKKLRKEMLYRWLNPMKREILFLQTDITESYRQEQERIAKTLEALRVAEAANRSKTEFVSRISHDIRTPISVISNMTDFAFEDIEDKEKLRDDLRKIRTANTFLLSLINDVLDISKIDSGKIELNPEPYPFSEYIAHIKNMFQPICDEKGLRLVIEEKKGEGVMVADKVRINQITLNLFSNAVKYTSPGGVITYSSRSRELPNNKILYAFELRDTGIGMSEEFQKTMFEPFTQEYDNPMRRKAESGTGLGLSIVKRDIDLMGGKIFVKSAPGEGTCIRCEIVFPDAARDERYKDRKAPERKPSGGSAALSGKVLLAEDNELNMEIADRLLSGFGLTVDNAENGFEAVKMFFQSTPGAYRAILMDLQMPILNGYEAAEKIRSLERRDAKSVPIIAMTADAFAEARERCAKIGMSDYIVKPLDPEQLKEALGRAFSGKAPGISEG